MVPSRSSILFLLWSYCDRCESHCRHQWLTVDHPERPEKAAAVAAGSGKLIIKSDSAIFDEEKIKNLYCHSACHSTGGAGGMTIRSVY